MTPEQQKGGSILNQSMDLIQNGFFADAYGLLEQFIAQLPDHTGITLFVMAAIQLGRWGKACQSAQKGVALYPQDPALRSSLAFILIKLKFFKEAQVEAQKAIELNPKQWDAYESIGHALLETGKVEESIPYLQKALQAMPQNADVMSRLGKAYTALFKTKEGEEYCRRSLELNPQNPDACTNLGMALRYQNRHQEAVTFFQKAISVDGNNPYAHLDLGVTYLLLGDYENGWKEYAYRLRTEGWLRDKFTKPMWDGKSFEGKTLLVHVEQGLGDSIQFLRFLPDLKKLGGTVILECQPELIRWVKNHPGFDILISKGEKRPKYDMHAYLMSLPELLKTTFPTLPPAICPIQFDPVKILQDGFKVGIVWAGSPGHTDDKRRSTRFEYFLPLSDIPGVKLLSLQKGESSKDVDGQCFVADGVGGCKDFVDTARVIQDLDLVITVDTSVAHLAATLGKTTWILLGFLPDWRWLLDRVDSPWYPSVRLFRQKKLGDWEAQFSQVKDELEKLLVQPK